MMGPLAHPRSLKTAVWHMTHMEESALVADGGGWGGPDSGTEPAAVRLRSPACAADLNRRLICNTWNDFSRLHATAGHACSQPSEML